MLPQRKTTTQPNTKKPNIWMMVKISWPGSVMQSQTMCDSLNFIKTVNLCQENMAVTVSYYMKSCPTSNFCSHFICLSCVIELLGHVIYVLDVWEQANNNKNDKGFSTLQGLVFSFLEVIMNSDRNEYK